MTNKQIYKATVGFSIRRMGWDMISFLIMGALGGAGFLVGNRVITDGRGHGMVGLGIGLVIGGLILVFVLRYVSYTYRAGQIAMMTRAVTEGSLPEDVIGEGKRVVRERFSTVGGYYIATDIIKGIFNQIGRGITAAGEAIGGEKGGAVGSAVSAAVSTVVDYLCDCCLGWVFYRSDIKAPKATLEGAVIFFRHGKTLARNLARVFGIGLLSFLVIGGFFTGVSYLVIANLDPQVLTEVQEAINHMDPQSSVIAFLQNPGNLQFGLSLVAGTIFWAILHSCFVRPFTLAGVLRNYLVSGMNDMPTEASFNELDSKSDKFAKLHREMA